MEARDIAWLDSVKRCVVVMLRLVLLELGFGDVLDRWGKARSRLFELGKGAQRLTHHPPQWRPTIRAERAHERCQSRVLLGFRYTLLLRPYKPS